MSDPHLRMRYAELPDRVGGEVEAAASLALHVLLEDIVAGRLVHLAVVTMTGHEAKVWELHEPPSPPDDLVRAIARREAPDALAFAYPCPLPPGVEGDRAINIAVEAADGKFDQLVALRGGPGDEQFRVYGRRHADPRQQWLGVEPDSEVQLWQEGPLTYFGPRGEA